MPGLLDVREGGGLTSFVRGQAAAVRRFAAEDWGCWVWAQSSLWLVSHSMLNDCPHAALKAYRNDRYHLQIPTGAVNYFFFTFLFPPLHLLKLVSLFGERKKIQYGGRAMNKRNEKQKLKNEKHARARTHTVPNFTGRTKHSKSYRQHRK